jgi:hypothetical protein
MKDLIVIAYVKNGLPFTDNWVNHFNRYSTDVYLYLHSDGGLSVSYCHKELSIEYQDKFLNSLSDNLRTIELKYISKK